MSYKENGKSGLIALGVSTMMIKVGNIISNSFMLSLDGLAAGAAALVCSAQMIGFASMSYKENGIGGFIALGVGTSMLQVANIIRNPFIIIPPTIAGAIIGPIGITMFEMTNN